METGWLQVGFGNSWEVLIPFTVKKLKAINTSSLEKLGDSVIDLAKFTEDEFGMVASAMQGTEPDHIWNKPPPKPRRGTYAYADGTNWNPGSGEGPYFFDGTNWNPLRYVDAPSDGNTYGRKNGAWVVVMVPPGGQTTTGGFKFTPYNIGTISSGTLTPNPFNQNYQYYTNNGAHTLAAPTSDCAIDVLMTNGASAVNPSFSGFTVGAVVGDPLNPTVNNKFLISIRRINSIATYTVKALQ